MCMYTMDNLCVCVSVFVTRIRMCTCDVVRNYSLNLLSFPVLIIYIKVLIQLRMIIAFIL